MDAGPMRTTRRRSPDLADAIRSPPTVESRHSVEPARRSRGAPTTSPTRMVVAERHASGTGAGAGGPPPGTPAATTQARTSASAAPEWPTLAARPGRRRDAAKHDLLP